MVGLGMDAVWWYLNRLFVPVQIPVSRLQFTSYVRLARDWFRGWLKSFCGSDGRFRRDRGVAVGGHALGAHPGFRGRFPVEAGASAIWGFGW
jgi:hypothetical protein